MRTDEDFVTALLEETGVALVHGTAFGLAVLSASAMRRRTPSESSVSHIQDFCAKIA